MKVGLSIACLASIFFDGGRSSVTIASAAHTAIDYAADVLL
jgi:hypothetical protein